MPQISAIASSAVICPPLEKTTVCRFWIPTHKSDSSRSVPSVQVLLLNHVASYDVSMNIAPTHGNLFVDDFRAIYFWLQSPTLILSEAEEMARTLTAESKDDSVRVMSCRACTTSRPLKPARRQDAASIMKPALP